MALPLRRRPDVGGPAEGVLKRVGSSLPPSPGRYSDLRREGSEVIIILVFGVPLWLQSHHTDQGNSETFMDALRVNVVKKVAIPPYRSGQFQASRLLFDEDWRASSQSHHTDQGNSEKRIGAFGDDVDPKRSQSHHTDQGNSECTPCNLLTSVHLIRVDTSRAGLVRGLRRPRLKPWGYPWLSLKGRFKQGT